MPYPVDNIRKGCKAKGITLAELERRLGIGNGVIARWETAKTYPPVDRLTAISKELDIPLEDLGKWDYKQEKPAPTNGNGYVDQFTEAAARLFGDHPEKLLRLLDALEKDPEKTKAKFDLFLATL